MSVRSVWWASSAEPKPTTSPLGIQIEQMMTDKGPDYRSKLFNRLLNALNITHLSYFSSAKESSPAVDPRRQLAPSSP